MSDWRCKLRAWNAWQAYVYHIRSDKEAQAVTMEMKEKHRYILYVLKGQCRKRSSKCMCKLCGIYKAALTD